MRTGPRCELDRDRGLTLWMAEGDWDRGPWTFATEQGGLAPVVENDIEGGVRLTITLPRGARTIQLRSAGGTPRWSLAVSDDQASAGQAEIDRLTAMGRSGQYGEALEQLLRFRQAAALSDRGPVDAAIGRMALGLGQVDRAEPAFRASIAAAKVAGRVSDVVRDGDALLWAYVVVQQRYADARNLLHEIEPYAGQYPEGQIWIDAGAGLLAADTADIRTALDRYQAAQAGARRLARSRLEQNAADDVARVLTRVGRADEAVTIQKALPPAADPCARATRALNLSEALMARAAQRPSPTGRDPEVTVALMAAQAATEGCPDSDRRLLATVNAADYAIEVGDDAQAGHLVERLQAAPPERDVLRSCRRADVVGRWLLRRGKPAAALAAFEAELPAARGRGLLDETFRAEVGAGRSLLAMGRRRVAVSRLRRAQRLLEEMLGGIPLGEGRDTFLGGHDEGVRTLVQALVDGGATAQAMNVARWIRSVELAHAARLDRLANLSPLARRRWDAALERYQQIRRDLEREAGDDWKAPRGVLVRLRTEREARAQQARASLDEAYRLLTEGDAPESDAPPGPAPTLTAPAPGELFVALFPGLEGWFAFAATPQAVTVHRIDAATFASTAAAAPVLALLDPELARAHRVRLFPYRAADRVSWQAVAWRGRPLLASVPVEYGLDVGWGQRRDAGKQPGAKRGGPSEGHPTALVVSNPTGDLPAAAREAQVVARALEHWTVLELDGATATRQATLEALSKARLFHYAGHAQPGAHGPLSSALVLSGEGRLELGDLLAAPAVPELVILSACEAAGTASQQPSLMGLAQAFVAAGAAAALAPTRPIRDADAQAFISTFYREFAPTAAGAAGDLLPHMRAALRATAAALLPATGAASLGGAPNRHDDYEQGSWSSFRLLVP